MSRAIITLLLKRIVNPGSHLSVTSKKLTVPLMCRSKSIIIVYFKAESIMHKWDESSAELNTIQADI